MIRGRARLAAALAAGLLLAAAALSSVARVEPGTLGVLPSGTVLPPGWHLAFPAFRLERVRPGPARITGSVAIDSPEGARREVPYRLEVEIGPEALDAAASDPHGGSPLARWRRAAEEAIRAAAAAPDGLALLRAGAGRLEALEALRARPPLDDSRATDLRLGASACARRRGRPLRAPVVLVGLDGADWLVIRPLLAAGALPNLDALVRSGARAHLRSSPPLLSPLLWTSVVTGIPPDRHGVVDFTVYDPATRDRAPVSSSARRAPALWNILTAWGLDSAWIGWWATWPAEPIAGLMVSDRVAYSLFAVGEGAEASEAAGRVYPPEAWPLVRERRTPAAAVPWRDLLPFVRLSPAEVQRLVRRPPPSPGSEFEDRLDHLRQIVASTRTYFEQAIWARRRLRPDLLAVYFQGIDEVSHRFMHYSPPPRMRLEARDVERYGRAVESFYREQDRLLGELLRAVPGAPAPIVMVVSDHGFLSGEARPPRPADEFEGGAADWHRLHGIFVLSGPGIEPTDLGTISIYDLFPTLLVLCGIPIPEGLPGRPLVEAFDPSLREALPPEKIAALDVPFGPEEKAAPLSEAEKEETLARLRALGYVGGRPAAGTPAAGAPLPPPAGAGAGRLDLDNEFLTAHMNLGTLYGERGEWAAAAAEYRSVAERFPTYAPALFKWMQSEFRRGDPAAAWGAAERLLALQPRPFDWLPAIAEVAAAAARSTDLRAALAAPAPVEHRPAVGTALGILALKEGRREEAAARLWRALEDDPLRPEPVEALHALDRSAAGRARMTAALRRALERAPRSVFHLNYLAGLLVSSGRCAEARPLLSAALEEDPDSAPAHVNLAKCLALEGSVDRALATLERGLARSPDDLGILTTLGALEAGRGRLERGIELLERARALSPADAGILNALALARLESGQEAQARELLQRSLASDPQQPDVRALLQKIGG